MCGGDDDDDDNDDDDDDDDELSDNPVSPFPMRVWARTPFDTHSSVVNVALVGPTLAIGVHASLVHPGVLTRSLLRNLRCPARSIDHHPQNSI